MRTMTLKRALRRGELAAQRTTLDACALEVLSGEVHRLSGRVQFYRDREAFVKALRHDVEVALYSTDSIPEKFDALNRSLEKLAAFEEGK